jgi:glycosyltransferase involved in cell wall biosynthesis
MRIAFDQQVFLLQEYGGISRYVCSLANSMSISPETTVKIFAPLHFNRYLEKLSPNALVLGKRAPRIPKTGRLISAMSVHLAHMSIKKFRPDIVHETYFSHVDFVPKGAKRVITVYDMIHERFASTWPGSEVTTAAKKEAVTRADHVICISESTRRDLLELFDIPEHKVSVTYLGFDALTSEKKIASTLTESSHPPYLLYVGGRGGYKNFEGLLRAVANSQFLKNTFSIICFGGGVFTKGEMSLIEELGMKSTKVRQIGGEDDILANLYLGAEAFICPSLYEGFGIPPLEAMSLGCPVICSDTSSLPEVVGDAGEYFDPGNIESICSAIERVVQSQTRRDELVEKGRKRCTIFSWECCANETLSIYRSLM